MAAPRDSGGRSTGSRPKTTPTAAPTGNPASPSTCPPFLDELLARQSRTIRASHAPAPAEHGGTGRYVFLGPDGGHYRRSNYARRVFRPACDGRYDASPPPGRLVIADATTWPGTPIAAWPPARPRTRLHPAARPRHPVIPDDTPLACWLPIKPGLTPHGLRHSHKTWMAEDGIPEILAEQRLGHEVPGMRGLYAHASDRMRDDLKEALQARWEDSLQARAAINEHSPVPLLDELLAPARATTREPDTTTAPPTAPGGRRQGDRPGDDDPKFLPTPQNGLSGDWHQRTRRVSDLVIRPYSGVELRGLEPLTPCLQRWWPRPADLRLHSSSPLLAVRE